MQTKMPRLSVLAAAFQKWGCVFLRGPESERPVDITCFLSLSLFRVMAADHEDKKPLLASEEEIESQDLGTVTAAKPPTAAVSENQASGELVTESFSQGTGQYEQRT